MKSSILSSNSFLICTFSSLISGLFFLLKVQRGHKAWRLISHSERLEAWGSVSS